MDIIDLEYPAWHTAADTIDGVSARSLQVVGQVENPLNLLDQFALVAPGQARPPTSVSILLDAGQQALQTIRLPSHTGLDISAVASDLTVMAPVDFISSVLVASMAICPLVEILIPSFSMAM